MASTIKWFGDNLGVNANPANNRDLSGGGTKFRFRTDDNWHTIDGTNPVPIPGAGSNYAGWIHFLAKMTARPGTEVVNNLKFYTDGTGYGTGIGVNIGNQFPGNTAASPEAGYEVTAFNPIGTTCYEMSVAGPNGHSVITSTADAFAQTSASPFTGPSISEASSQLDAVGEMSNYFCVQASVDNTAGAGVKAAETYTIRYDETE